MMAIKASNIKPAVACAQGSISAYIDKTVEDTLTEDNPYIAACQCCTFKTQGGSAGHHQKTAERP